MRPLSRAIGLAIVLGVLCTQLVQAHAYLDYTEPPLGASLEASPSEFSLYFTERIDPSFGSFSLVNETGEVLIQFTPQLKDDDHHVFITFESPLSDGVHRIAWEIMSAVDGHITSGVVPFSVGEVTAAVEIHTPDGVAESPSIFRVIARWLSYLSMLVLVGSLFFTLLISKRASEESAEISRWTKLIWISIGIFFVAEASDILMQAQAIGVGFLQLLLDSQWGMARLGKLLFVGSISLLTFLPPHDKTRLWGSRAAGVLMILVHANASHNAGMIGTQGFLLDALHLMAAALWLGGLVQLALIYRVVPAEKKLSENIRTTAETISRFSQMALVSVGLLIASGLLTVTSHIPSWAALTGSLYGQALLGKIGLLVVVVGIAIANRFYFLPKILVSGKAAKTLFKLRRLIRIEASVVVAILLFAAVMTTTSPPHEHGAQSGETGPIVLTQQLESATIDLNIAPLIEGERVIEARIVNLKGEPLADVLRVWLDMTYLDEDLGGVEINPIAEPTEIPGFYRMSGPYLNLDGQWKVAVNVRISGHVDDLMGVFQVEVQ